VKSGRKGGSGVLSFGVDDEANWRHGLPCGGTIEVLVQSVDDDHFPFALFGRLAQVRERSGEGFW
jgi:xanthine dehydrogenase accessory factor